VIPRRVLPDGTIRLAESAIVGNWPQPAPGVSCLKINRSSGALAGENDPFAVRECFLAGTEPTQQQLDAPPPTPDDFYQEPR